MNKDAQRFLQEAERQGFVSKPVKKGLMYLAPNGIDKITIHLTPSDRRALDNMIAAFKRAGMIWPVTGISR
jgi:hypothetical protein